MFQIKSTKILSIIIGSTLIAVPFIASAKDLTLFNSTKVAFTSSVNGDCGLANMKAHQAKTFDEDTLVKMCGKNTHHCEVMMFNSTNCTGQPIGNFVLDIKNGVSTFASAEPYSLSVNFAMNWVTVSEAL